MKSGISGIIALVFVVLLAVVGLSSTFTVHQTEQALVLRFGEPVPGRGLVTQPGLHFKLPFIENVIYLDNRLLKMETPNLEVLASDRQRLEVDAFAIYRIAEPLKFYQTVGTIARADNQLGSVLNSALRRVLGEATQQEIVNQRRAELMVRLRDYVNTEGQGLGVNVVDVRIRRADLPNSISAGVYERMKSERQREAADYRGRGAQAKETISAQADAEVTVLRANAQQEADTVRGQGDAERNQIFADAFGKDPDFAAFYRSLQAYDASLKGKNTRMLLAPTSDFFKYLNKLDAKADLAPAKGGTAPAPAAPPSAPAPSPKPASVPPPAGKAGGTQ